MSFSECGETVTCLVTTLKYLFKIPFVYCRQGILLNLAFWSTIIVDGGNYTDVFGCSLKWISGYRWYYFEKPFFMSIHNNVKLQTLGIVAQCAAWLNRLLEHSIEHKQFNLRSRLDASRGKAQWRFIGIERLLSGQLLIHSVEVCNGWSSRT